MTRRRPPLLPPRAEKTPHTSSSLP
uniref:Uncharacterized protein n=1 Tax=Arundo donax TaxID=35708 RepID=A0A0A9B376_ARUDO